MRVAPGGPPDSSVLPRSHPMRARTALVLALAGCLGASLPAVADVVTTRDGLALEGTVARPDDATVVVTTADGAVRLRAADVVSVAPGEGPRGRARREA